MRVCGADSVLSHTVAQCCHHEHWSWILLHGARSALPTLPSVTPGLCQVVHTHKPHFMALHCQEFGGKNYEASMSHVDKFVKELLSSDAMKEYNRARVYLDENYKSQEHFTALGSFYFLHESLKNIYQFDFKAKKYRKVAGKEIYSDTLESTPMLEKEKFPQDYFPECKWSRKGFIRTRWCIADWYVVSLCALSISGCSGQDIPSRSKCPEKEGDGGRQGEVGEKGGGRERRKEGEREGEEKEVGEE
ncbi:hypothetical protein H8959_011784 [Pygathrix nigripes]